MLRRWVTQPLVLSEPTDLARFMLLVAPIGCFTSATLATASTSSTRAPSSGTPAIASGAPARNSTSAVTPAKNTRDSKVLVIAAKRMRMLRSTNPASTL